MEVIFAASAPGLAIEQIFSYFLLDGCRCQSNKKYKEEVGQQDEEEGWIPVILLGGKPFTNRTLKRITDMSKKLLLGF